MDILKFTLKGKTAFFKKPDVNTYLYFTYGNIHKCALLGIFGALLGYGGYNEAKLKAEINKNKSVSFPEYYEKLKNIKISIVPLNKNGFISKKIQSFNNSVGYASKEVGGNLIVKEQWLENPAWDVYLMLDNDESQKIADSILNNVTVFNPYLGKNDHPADIIDGQIIKEVKSIDEVSKISSLVLKDDISILFDEEEEDEEEDYFKYEEYLPVKLNENTSLYELKKFVCTNMKINAQDIEVYNIDEKNIVFY